MQVDRNFVNPQMRLENTENIKGKDKPVDDEGDTVKKDSTFVYFIYDEKGKFVRTEEEKIDDGLSGWYHCNQYPDGTIGNIYYHGRENNDRVCRHWD